MVQVDKLIKSGSVHARLYTDQEIFQQEMRDSKADWQMIYYANSVHSFTDPTAGNDNSKGVAYNEKAAKRSWKAMMDFFEEVLK